MPRFATLCAALLLTLTFTPDAAAQRVACENGAAAGYECDGIDLLSHLSLGDLGASGGNDIWGWTDPETGKEYALMGVNNGTAFVDVSDPVNPVYLGKLPTQTSNSTWRDIKVYADHAFVVSEAGGHGMQVFDLTRLRDVPSPPQTFTVDAHYSQHGNAHNLVINEESGFAYVVGISTWDPNGCAGGLHMVNIQDPLNPTFAGCFDQDGYTHDAQCVVYHGPDTEHQGKEICLASNEDTVTIVDVTDKSNPVQLSQATYPNDAYTHQGWLTEDHRTFIANDELDEMYVGSIDRTRTLIFDVEDLDAPEFVSEYFHPVASTDHNLYVKGNYVYLANYKSGLRVLDLQELLSGEGSDQLGYFDTYPGTNSAGTDGMWSNYPFFESGIVVASDIQRGLFILDPKIETNPPVDTETAAPGAFELTEAYPNPFSDRTQFTLRVAEAQAVEISVYNVLGRRVAALFQGTLSADEERTVVFDAGGLPAGAYFVRVSGETFAETRQVTLAR